MGSHLESWLEHWSRSRSIGSMVRGAREESIVRWSERASARREMVLSFGRRPTQKLTFPDLACVAVLRVAVCCALRLCCVVLHGIALRCGCA